MQLPPLFPPESGTMLVPDTVQNAMVPRQYNWGSYYIALVKQADANQWYGCSAVDSIS